MEDDVLALQDLYPADDDSSCTGPYRQGERCDSNCDCLSDFICMQGAHGFPVCTPQCSSETSTCPPTFTCLFGQKDEDDVAEGICHQLGREDLNPIGSYCETNNQCTTNSCLAVNEVGRSVCRQTCDSAADCEGEYNYQCVDGVCLGPGKLNGISCSGRRDGLPMHRARRINTTFSAALGPHCNDWVHHSTPTPLKISVWASVTVAPGYKAYRFTNHTPYKTWYERGNSGKGPC